MKAIRSIKGEGGLVITLFYFQNFNICKSSTEEKCFYILQKCKSSFNNVFPLKGSLFNLIWAGKRKRSGGNGTTRSTLVTQSYAFTAACTRTILISVYDLISLQTVCMFHYAVPLVNDTPKKGKFKNEANQTVEKWNMLEISGCWKRRIAESHETSVSYYSFNY